ncbi:MAG TPA: hypothetical protein ENK85_05580, partial [Saprospiraceae bacterium]|nr:hypothetical protein [Saprospiraceae bacterium]
NGCTNSSTTDIVVNPLPVVNAGTYGPVCIDGASITLAGTPAGGTFSGPGVSGTSFDPASAGAGTHTITYNYTDGNGCANSATTSIVVNALPIVNATSNGPVCNGADLQLTDSSPNAVAWTWEGPNGFSDTTQNPMIPGVSMLANGQYFVTVIDNNGCSNDGGVNVVVNPTPSLNVISNSPVCSGNDLTLGEIAGDAVSWSWSGPNGQASTLQQPIFSNVTELDAGTYTVTITDVNGCTDSTSTDIVVHSLPIVDAGTYNPVCIDGGIFTLQGTPAGGVFTGVGVVGSTFDPAQAGVGVHTIIYDYTDINGCSAQASTNVTVNALPIVTISAVGPVCYDEAPVLLSGNPVGGTFAGAGVSGNFFYPSVAGVGTQTITYKYKDSNGCFAQATMDIVVNSLPIADAGAPDTVRCNKPNVLLDGSLSSKGNMFSYQWTTNIGNIVSGGTTLNPIVNAGGVYVLNVTNIVTGCNAVDSVVIVDRTLAPIAKSALPDTLTCDRAELNLDATASSQGSYFDYQWTTVDGLIVSGETSLEPTVNRPGTYVLEVTNTRTGCNALTDVKVFQDIVQPSADAGADQKLTCFASDVVLLGSAYGANGIYDFEWVTTDGHIVSGEHSLNPLVDSAGSYTLKVIDKVNGCVNTDDVDIVSDIQTPEVVSYPPSELNCLISEVVISAQSSNATLDFTWTTDDGEIKTGANTSTPLVTEPGTYTFVATDVANGCTATNSITVSENVQVPVADAGDNQFLNCDVNQMAIGGVDNGNYPNYTFSWLTSDGSFVTAQDVPNPVINEEGVYMVHVVDTENGCTADDTLTVIKTPGIVDMQLDLSLPSCRGTGGVISVDSVLGGTAPYVYSFNDGQSFGTIDEIGNLEPGTYGVVVQDGYGCEYNTTVTLPTPQAPEILVEPNVEIELGDSTMLEVFTDVLPEHLDTVMWNPINTLSCTDCLSPYASPMATTLYQVWVVDDLGCRASANITVNVVDPDVFIPNIFAPGSGDDRNNHFSIFANPEKIDKILELRIFDRWGTMVYEGIDLPPNNPSFGWDGTYHGRKMDPAVFVYSTKVRWINGKEKVFKGDITLIR